MKLHFQKLFAPILILLTLVMHAGYFNRELTGYHVWRQTQTQSTLISFYEEDMNILNPKRNERGNGDGMFRMEFPLMQWSGAAIYKLFGPNLLWIRVWMFVIGLFSVWGMYQLVWKLFENRATAMATAWAFNFSPSFYYYTVNPMPDNLALCFVIWSLAFFVMYYRNQSRLHLWLSGLFLALATLCKLPFVVFYALPFTYQLLQIVKEKKLKQAIQHSLPILAFMPFPAIWYVWVIPGWHNTEVSKGLMANTESLFNILDYLQGNLISSLPELLTNYAAFPLFVAGCFYLYKYPNKSHKLLIALAASGCAVLCYFLFEINMIGTMHDYYLFPFLPLIFILVGFGFKQLYSGKKQYKVLAITLILLTPITAHLRIKGRWNPESVGFNKDLMDYKNQLRAAVPDNALCIVGNDESHFIMYYFLHKKGWGYDNNNLNETMIKSWISEGAQYWYNDTRELETPEILAQTERLVAEFGSVRVYQLREAR